jgi:hypothetical protein
LSYHCTLAVASTFAFVAALAEQTEFEGLAAAIVLLGVFFIFSLLLLRSLAASTTEVDAHGKPVVHSWWQKPWYGWRAASAAFLLYLRGVDEEDELALPTSAPADASRLDVGLSSKETSVWYC